MLLHYTFLLQCAALVYANDALNVNTNTQNDKHVDEAITQLSSDWYYAICAIMGVTATGILCASYLKPRSDRIFFYMCATICTTACIAYYAMGSNLGWTPIDNEQRRQISGVNGRNREIFYVRYIDWFVTTPLLLLDLLLTAGLLWPSIIWTIFLDIVMVVTGLVRALTKTRYKWGFYTAGCVAMILLYLVAQGLCEGGNVITPNDKAFFYGCLDFIAKPVFSIALIYGHQNINPARLGLAILSGEERAEQLLKKHDGLLSNGHGHDQTGQNGGTRQNGANGSHRVPDDTERTASAEVFQCRYQRPGRLSC